MSKKKIIIISIILFVFVIALLLFIGLRNINNDEVEEVEIKDNTTTSEQQNTNNTNNTSNTINNSNNSEELTQMTQDEIQDYEIYDRLTSNRSLSASPSYKFKSDDFETVPKDDNWFETIAYELNGGPVSKDLFEHISKVDVYNLKETKTNFIIVEIDKQILIYQMYKSEATNDMTYEILDTNGQDEAFVKVISDKGDKLLSKKNPKSVNIGQW